MKNITIAALAVLTFTAISPTSAKADELANPVQGAIVRHFNWKTDHGSSPKTHEKNFLEQVRSLLSGEKAPAENSVDTSESFNTLSQQSDRRISIWDGCLKSVSGGRFTFTLCFKERNYWTECFAIWINGQQLVLDDRRAFSGDSAPYAFNVILKPGFNSIRIALESTKYDPLSMSYKKADSLQAPRNIGPGDLWREGEIEEEEEW